MHTRALRRLAGTFDAETFDVTVTADITRSGRRAADLLTLTEAGEIEICYFSASYLSRRVPELRLLDQPFAFTDRRGAYETLDGELGAVIREKLEAPCAYRILGWWDNGFRHLTSGRRPIRTPRDCRGQRLRTMSEAPQHELLFAAMEATGRQRELAAQEDEPPRNFAIARRAACCPTIREGYHA